VHCLHGAATVQCDARRGRVSKTCHFGWSWGPPWDARSCRHARSAFSLVPCELPVMHDT
jgi:hypothetical protein